MRLKSVALCLLLAAPQLFAAPLTASSRSEIDALLAKLQASACEFKRNDAWHNASEAKTHLLRKLEYLEARDAVQTTEQFIKLAASKSSTSGRPYQVRCAGAPPVDSSVWLNAQLKRLRSGATSATASAR